MSVQLYSQLESFHLLGAKPHSEEIVIIDQDTFPGRWKVINFYEYDFCKASEVEFYEWHSLSEHFADLDAAVLFVSNDHIVCKQAWKKYNVQLQEFDHWLCSDPGMPEEPPLSYQVGAYNYATGENQRLTLIVDPDNTVQFVYVTPSTVTRSAVEIIRILEALQGGGSVSGEMPDGGSMDFDPLTPHEVDKALDEMK